MRNDAFTVSACLSHTFQVRCHQTLLLTSFHIWILWHETNYATAKFVSSRVTSRSTRRTAGFLFLSFRNLSLNGKAIIVLRARLELFLCIFSTSRSSSVGLNCITFEMCQWFFVRLYFETMFALEIMVCLEFIQRTNKESGFFGSEFFFCFIICSFGFRFVSVSFEFGIL